MNNKQHRLLRVKLECKNTTNNNKINYKNSNNKLEYKNISKKIEYKNSNNTIE